MTDPRNSRSKPLLPCVPRISRSNGSRSASCSNLLCRIARPHDDFYALTGRSEQWSAKPAHLLGHLVRISVDKDRNTPRNAFDRERLRDLVDVEQGQLRRVPLGEHLSRDGAHRVRSPKSRWGREFD